MPRATLYCPVDPVTAKLLPEATVRTAKDFSGFLDWLTLDSQKELRGRAYAAIDGKEPTLVAKAMLIDSVAGSYIHQVLIGANRSAALAQSPDAGASEQRSAHEVVGRARGELKGLKDAIQSVLFEGQLRRSAMGDEAIERLVEAFDGQNKLAKNVAIVMAEAIGREKTATEKGIVDAMRRYLETKERRAEIKRSASGMADEAADVAKLGLFAPLVRYIETIEQPKARAEMLAHLEDYVRSGWFFQDIVEKSTTAECSLGAWWGAIHGGAEPLRAAFAKIEAGQRVPDHEIGAMFERRVSELALSVKTGKSASKAGAALGEDAPWQVTEASHLDPRQLFASTAGSAEIDSFWISPDNQRYFLSCATSTSTLGQQDDQMGRYRQAVELAIESGRMGGFAIPCAPISIDARTISLCSAQAKSSRKGPGRQAGDGMIACFEKGTPAQERALIPLLNALPGVALLVSNERYCPKDYSRYRFELFGEREAIWPACQAKANAIEGLSDHAKGVAALASYLGAFGEHMESMPLKQLEMRSSAGGLGEKPYHMLEGLLMASVLVCDQFDQMASHEKIAVAGLLAKGAGPLGRSFANIKAPSLKQAGMHKRMACMGLAAIDEFAQAQELRDQVAASKKARSTPRKTAVKKSKN